MVIAVNCRLLLHNKLEGIGRYMHETLRRLVLINPQHQFIFIFDRPWNTEFIYAENVTPVAAFPQARHPLLYYWWFNFSLPKIFKKYQVDIFLSQDGYLSLRTNIPQISVIHDLAFEHLPEGISKSELYYYKTYFPQFAKKAAQIITVSEYTKNDIHHQYGISLDKIKVSCNAASAGFKPLDDIEVKNVRIKYSAGKPYFFFVGALHPRKNLSNLLLAFDYLKKQTNCEHQLLIAGRAAWKNGHMKEVYDEMQFKHEVIFTGRLPEVELQRITASAFTLCYVSLFEGFGIPILEAMQARVPVITSNISSMPEIANDAAILVNPLSPTEIAEAMMLLISDEKLRRKYKEKGIMRAQHYTWEKATEVLQEAIFSV